MPVTEIRLPTGEQVRLVFLRDWNNLGDMVYLQAVRSGRLKPDSPLIQSYKGMATHYARKLDATVAAIMPKVDAIVSPPSSRDDADIYRKVIVARAGAPDLTAGFSRRGDMKAATVASWEEVRDAFTYTPGGLEKEITSLLIVDESVASGKTVAAALHHLRKAGLATGCQVTVAAAAWLKS